MTELELFTSSRGGIYQEAITDTCRASGVKLGDIVMVHARLFTLGRVAHGITKDELADAIIDAFLQAVGRHGTVIFPTFTLAVCKSGLFDVSETKSEMGILSERARKRTDSWRLKHPFFSVSVFGERKNLFDDVQLSTCFGENSFFDVLHQINNTEEYNGNVKFITLGIDQPPEAITYIHSIEEKLSVPYRYHKYFQGSILSDGIATPYNVDFFVRDLNREVVFDAEACWKLLSVDEAVKASPLGDSFIAVLPEATVYTKLDKKISQKSDFLCRGGYYD